MPAAIRIAVVDAYALLRDGVRKLFEDDPEISVVGEASNGQDAIAMARRTEPDILLLDYGIATAQTPELLRAIAAAVPTTRILVLIDRIEPADTVKTLQVGARGLFAKDASADVLRKALRVIMDGQYWIGRESVSGLVDTLKTHMFDTQERKYGLTARELQIIAAVTAGYANKEIAKRFSLSEETVKHHLTKIYSKVGVSNRLELALFTISERLLDRS